MPWQRLSPCNFMLATPLTTYLLSVLTPSAPSHFIKAENTASSSARLFDWETPGNSMLTLRGSPCPNQTPHPPRRNLASWLSEHAPSVQTVRPGAASWKVGGGISITCCNIGSSSSSLSCSSRRLAHSTKIPHCRVQAGQLSTIVWLGNPSHWLRIACHRGHCQKR